MISWRNAKVLDAMGNLQLSKFSQGTSLEGDKFFDAVSRGELRGVLVGERDNQDSNLSR